LPVFAIIEYVETTIPAGPVNCESAQPERAMSSLTHHLFLALRESADLALGYVRELKKLLFPLCDRYSAG
jgi:hypothetical protein